ncbi:MAG TPA: hypothetical protein VFK36_00755, partial [Gemmatimonadales bacterium]|nr:hypothetical protein [Gemmatimonadales bacterium]
MRSRLSGDFERFGRELPADWAAHVREQYRIDLTASYLGASLPHPIGKASGQLSLNTRQLEQDREAGIAFVVLKTVIGERDDGSRTMGAWATDVTRMQVERRDEPDGRSGWTVTWKGRGWAGTLANYAELVRAGRDMTRAGGPLVVPSAKLHLPVGDEPFDAGEYRHTLRALQRAWGEGTMLLEKDFSPTLAGDSRADEQETILRWVRQVPQEVRSHASGPLRLSLKLMNARFDDAFQGAMLDAAAGADGVTVFNRLWDPEAQVAYGGWALSDRNLRVLDQAGRGGPERSGTGNICSGRQIVAYARCGCTSMQLHTAFQWPLSAYLASAGSRSQRTVHALVFGPEEGLIASMLDLEAAGLLERRSGELHFSDLCTR